LKKKAAQSGAFAGGGIFKECSSRVGLLGVASIRNAAAECLYEGTWPACRSAVL
jgi:hypothetical protein